MELIEQLYHRVNNGKILLKAKFEIEVTGDNRPTEVADGVYIYDSYNPHCGLKTVHGILFESEGNYISILPSFLDIDNTWDRCGSYGSIELYCKIWDDMQTAITKFEEVCNGISTR